MKETISGVIRRFIVKTTHKNTLLYKSYLKNAKSLLDVGSGNSMQALSVTQELPNLKVTCLDIDDYRWNESHSLKHVVYDGKHFPFSDNSFDKTLVSLVLHHVDDLDVVIKECLRVTKDEVLILEEVYTNKLQEVLMVCYDIVVNFILFGKRISLPHFYSEKKWKKIFTDVGVQNISFQTLPNVWWRVPKRLLIILQK